MLEKKAKKTSFLVRILFAALVALVVFVVGLSIKNSTTSIYAGKLPCADCDGIVASLTLHGNNTYEMSSLYINKGEPFIEKGTWQQEEKNAMQVYVLTSNNHVVSYYQILDDKTIRLLGMDGKPIKSPFKMILTKQ